MIIRKNYCGTVELLTPCIENDLVASVVKDVLRIAQAFDIALLCARNTTPGNLVRCSILNAIQTNGRITLEEMNRRLGVLRVIPPDTARAWF